MRYRQIMYRKGVIGIVFNKAKKFLILHRVLHWKGWEFSKGGIDKGETAEEALLREIKEETGLDGQIVCKLSLEISYKYPTKFIESTKTKYDGAKQDVYLVGATGKASISAEHDKCRWVSYKVARKLLKHESQKKALDAAYQYRIKHDNISG